MFLSVCLSVNVHVCKLYQSVCIFKLLFLSVLLPLSSCADPERGGIGGPDPPPGKSQVKWGSIEISIWTPLEEAGPPGRCWTPHVVNAHVCTKATVNAPFFVSRGPYLLLNLHFHLRPKKKYVCLLFDENLK